MTVQRIVTNIAADSVPETAAFYRDLLEMDIAMDLDWITTLVSDTVSTTQISIATEGGSGTAVPDISIEVDDVGAVHQRAIKLGIAIKYPLTDEPWGVRRFFVSDPTGKVLNILAHL